MTHTSAVPKTVGERIFWARKRKGISQVRLAAMIGSSQRHIVRLEKNENSPKLPMREQLAVALDQKPEFFEASGGDDDEESDMSRALARALHEQIRSIVRSELGVLA